MKYIVSRYPLPFVSEKYFELEYGLIYTNEVPMVPVYYPAKQEQEWQNQRGKNALMSLTLAWHYKKTTHTVFCLAHATMWVTTDKPSLRTEKERIHSRIIDATLSPTNSTWVIFFSRSPMDSLFNVVYHTSTSRFVHLGHRLQPSYDICREQEIVNTHL